MLNSPFTEKFQILVRWEDIKEKLFFKIREGQGLIHELKRIARHLVPRDPL
jgi:hypothetical protein